MDRFCLECNILLKGRADKKFCDDHCRSNFNYRLKADDRSFINLVNQILKKNRDILKTESHKGKTKLKRGDLLIKSFDFNFHTYSQINKKGDTYFFCYEYGYLVLANEEVVLVKMYEK